MRKVVIYNSYRPEKYDLFMGEFERQKIDVEIFHCEQNQNYNVVEKISESFKTVIREAKERGDKEICIFEDDILFPSENGWEYFIENKPENFSVYIGGNYVVDNRLKYKPPIIKVDVWVGNHCIIVNESYYDIWLNTDSKLHCDSVHAGLGNFYACFPYPALQRTGWSANTQTVVNYNSPRVLPPEYIYK